MNKIFIQYYKTRARGLREAGQVAIVTVTMFMLLFSILLVSFTRVMVNASHQTANDELKARARAAAESGIEDAKRILSYCYSEENKVNPNSTCVNNILKNSPSQTCETILSDDELTNALNITKDDDGRAKVDVLSERERYLCLKINPLTDNIEGALSGEQGESKVIPLDLRDSNGELEFATNLTLQWHLLKPLSEGGDGQNINILSGDDWPQVPEWGDSPAALRVELVKVDEQAGFTIEQLSQDARRVSLRPTSDSADASIYMENFVAKDDVNSQVVPLKKVSCSTGHGDYACSANLNISGSAHSANTKYYLRVQVVYSSATHFRVSAQKNRSTLYFNGVQPEVDVTGQSLDSFQRIRARIEMQPNGDAEDIFSRWWPEYAVDTDGKVCKKMKISSINGKDECD